MTPIFCQPGNKLTSFKSNTSEIQEALRLSQILQKPEMNAIWTLKDEAYASKLLQAIMRPVQSTTAPPTGSLNSESASYRQNSAM